MSRVVTFEDKETHIPGEFAYVMVDGEHRGLIYKDSWSHTGADWVFSVKDMEASEEIGDPNYHIYSTEAEHLPDRAAAEREAKRFFEVQVTLRIVTYVTIPESEMADWFPGREFHEGMYRDLKSISSATPVLGAQQ